MSRIFFSALLLLLIISPLSFSEEEVNKQIVINNIVISGNTRVTNSTILTYSEVSVGDVYTSELASSVIKKLYDTQYFDDISVTIDFNNLIIKVIERPIISSIQIEGNSLIQSEDIITALENVGVIKTRPFDKNIYDKTEQELVRLYYDRGRYSATVKTGVKNLERNRVALTLTISEGEASRIKEINFIGNEAFTSRRLKGIMDSGTKYFFEFWSDKDTYSGSRLQSDLDKINNFYLNQGYVRFKILSNQVNLTNDNKDIILTINLEEGDLYQFGDIKLFGNTTISESIIKSSINKIISPGQTFGRFKVEASKESISYLLGDRGFAFPEIISIPLIDDETKIVDIEFRVNPGQKSTVRRINITGNQNTNDEVYRRELRQYESSLHSNSKIERSKIRLQRLKFVQNVDVSKTKVAGTNDLVDITYDITEKQAGEFKVSAGYSDIEGALFNIKLQQDNFLGGGNNVALEANKTTTTASLQVFYTDPYYTTDGISKTSNIVFSQTDVSSASTASYVADAIGGGVFYSSPISETESFGIGYDVLLTDYTTTAGSPVIVTHHIAEHGNTALGVEFKINYVDDDRDRTVFASTGRSHALTTNVFAPITGAGYASASYKGEFNRPFTFKTFGLFDWETVLQAKTTVGVGMGLFGSTSMPFHSKFFAGGSGTVRGFKGASLGPLTYNGPPNAQYTKRCSAKGTANTFKCDTVGGDFLTVAQFNWIFPPPPFLGIDTRSVRLSLFSDIGNVFEKIGDFDYNELRASYGIEAKFMTPVGGVSIGFVDTFKSKTGDDTQPVIFSLGGTF